MSFVTAGSLLNNSEGLYICTFYHDNVMREFQLLVTGWTVHSAKAKASDQDTRMECNGNIIGNLIRCFVIVLYRFSCHMSRK